MCRYQAAVRDRAGWGGEVELILFVEVGSCVCCLFEEGLNVGKQRKEASEECNLFVALWGSHILTSRCPR